MDADRSDVCRPRGRHGIPLREVGIRSLAEFKPGPVRNGHMYPGPEYFMEKMLERWKFVQYLLGSRGRPGTFVKNLIEPKIVIDNGFPNLNKNINTDFSRPRPPVNPPEQGRLMPLPRRHALRMPFIDRPMLAGEALAA